jgi:hypothetical protein
MDLAVGVPYQSSSSMRAYGAVEILRGSYSGLTAARERWTQDIPGSSGAAEPHDLFGAALAVGDFNSDGYEDLAVGASGEDVGSIRAAGLVNVIYGSPGGLEPSGAQAWSQNSPGVPGTAERGDGFGSALATGDFDADGYVDLAVGIQYENVGDSANAGAVDILYGSVNGLAAGRSQHWHQNSSGVPGQSEPHDYFGSSLATGDFDGDGYADLAVGVRGEDVGELASAGATAILYGGSGGLAAAGSQLWHQNSSGLPGEAEPNDGFGWTLAAADFDDDGFVDLAVGVPYEDIGDVSRAGAVNVLFGSEDGLTASGSQHWHQNSSGLAGEAEREDRFGHALATGDFDGDGHPDLAVGVPGEDIGSIGGAGAVSLLLGSDGGLTGDGKPFWHQDRSGIPGEAEAGDSFGRELAAGTFCGTKHLLFLPLQPRRS